MGNCTTKRSDKPSKNYSSSVKISVPDLTYIDRKSKTLISVIRNESFQISLKKKLKLYKDSCISCLTNGSIIIAGGSDSSNSLTNNVFLINPSLKSLRILPSLPIPCKFGSFLNNSRFFYYISGICESQDHDSCSAEEATTPCRLDFETMKWELFICKPRFNPAKFLQRKICVEDEDGRISMFRPSGVQMKDLFEPGAVLFEDKVYLIGGKILQNGERVPSDKIFSVEFSESCFCVNEENVSLPSPLVAPSCSVQFNQVCIGGGFLSDMSMNFALYVLNLSFMSVRKLNLDLDRPLEPRYPIFMDEKGIICISPPKMLYLREDKQQVFSFSMPSVLKLTEFKSVSDDSMKQTEYEKKVVDLSLNFIVVQEKKEENFDCVEEFVQKNEAKFSENPFDVAVSADIDANLEQSKALKKAKIVNCQCGAAINSGVTKAEVCLHCKEIKKKVYFCHSCNTKLCRKCLKELQKFRVRNDQNFLCTKRHLFCEFRDKFQKPEPHICLNCNQLTQGSYLFCFLCQEALCHPCESLIDSFIYPIDIQCSQYHDLSWKLSTSSQSPNTCDNCLNLIKQLGYFYCEPCKFSLCLICVNRRKETNPSNKVFIKACSFQERPKRLSDTFYRNEFNKGDEPIDNSVRVPKLKKLFSNNIAKINKVEVRVDSEPGCDSPRPNFGTTIEEIKKKILPKPRRGTQTPFLSLSPRKNLNLNCSDSVLSPVLIPQKTLKDSDDDLEGKADNKNRLKLLSSNKIPPKPTNSRSHKPELMIAVHSPSPSPSPNPPDLLNKTSSLEDQNDTQYLNPLDSPQVSFACSVHSIVLNNNPSKSDTLSSDNQINLENVPNAINDADLLAPCNRLSDKNSLEPMDREPSLFSTYGDDPDNFVAPDIRGTLAAGKLIALKAKLNIMTARNGLSSSTSEENSPIGFVFTDRPQDWSSKSSNRESLSKRESKRYYSVDDESFSKDQEAEEDEKNSESSESGYQIQLE